MGKPWLPMLGVTWVCSLVKASTVCMNCWRYSAKVKRPWRLACCRSDGAIFKIGQHGQIYCNIEEWFHKFVNNKLASKYCCWSDVADVLTAPIAITQTDSFCNPFLITLNAVANTFHTFAFYVIVLYPQCHCRRWTRCTNPDFLISG